MKPNQKSNTDLKIEYDTNYKDKTAFASRARLSQSIWRTEEGYEFEKYGNFLKLDFAKKSGANFLTKEIYKIVEHEVENKSKDRKVIKEPRIWNNLLSSQPMAFNLFGELKLHKNIATEVFKNLYPEKKIKEVTQIEFEYSPGRRSEKYTSDSSAFDIFVAYDRRDQLKGFFGIEVKYSEGLQDDPSTHKKRYEEISEESGKFDMSKLEDLKNKPIQQIWRDHLLTLSMSKINKDYDFGDFVYLYPEENNKCQNGVDKYQAVLNGNTDTHFYPLTLEKFVGELKRVCSEPWVTDFEDRYLNFEKIENKKEARS